MTYSSTPATPDMLASALIEKINAGLTIEAGLCHEAALALAEAAEQRPEQAARWLEQASRLEAYAAERFDLGWRPLSYRSAACFALRAGKTEEARRLAEAGLQCHPRPEIQDELWALMDRATSNAGQSLSALAV